MTLIAIPSLVRLMLSRRGCGVLRGGSTLAFLTPSMPTTICSASSGVMTAASPFHSATGALPGAVGGGMETSCAAAGWASTRTDKATQLCMDMHKLVGRNVERLRNEMRLTKEQLAEIGLLAAVYQRARKWSAQPLHSHAF